MKAQIQVEQVRTVHFELTEDEFRSLTSAMGYALESQAYESVKAGYRPIHEELMRLYRQLYETP